LLYNQGRETESHALSIMKNWLSNNREKPLSKYPGILKEKTLNKYQSVLREKAIEQAKVEIALAGKNVEDYDQNQLEVIVKAQEDKIKSKYRNGTLAVLLLAIGIY
jgi:hypothetical protein